MINPIITEIASWSAITGIIIIVVGLVYKKFSEKQKDEPSPH